MDKNEEKRVIVEMNFAPRERYQPVLESIRRNVRISVDRLRARLTDSEAWFEMEISGPSIAVDDFLHRHRGRIAAAGAVA